MSTAPYQQRSPIALSERLAATFAATTEMERNGIYIDADVARWLAHDAIGDEARELEWLRAWWEDHGWIDRSEPANGVSATQGRYPDAIWSSSVNLPAFLHTPLGLNLKPSPFWKKGQVKRGDIKTDSVALEYLAGQHPQHREGLRHLLALRRERSVLKYLRKLPTFIGPDGLVHPVYGPAGDDDDRVGALTGRKAAKNPEVQQIPIDTDKDTHRVRKVFRARRRRKEKLVIADFSALEVRVLAQLLIWLFKDDGLAARIRPGAPDIHAVTAHYVFRQLQDPVALGLSEADFVRAANEELPPAYLPPPPEWVRESGRRWDLAACVDYCHNLRNLVKRIRYGLNYGKGAWGFGSTLFLANGDPLGEERAQKMVDALLDMDPGVRSYMEWVRAWIKKHHGIPSLDGRWCDLADLVQGDDWQVNRAWRRALNFPMQAGGADVVDLAMTRLAFHPRLRALGFVLTLQVHDELHFRGPECNAAEAAAIVKYEMEHVADHLFRGFDVPLGASVHQGDDWESTK